MKTKKQSKNQKIQSEFENRTEQLGNANTLPLADQTQTDTAAAPAPAKRPFVDFKKREENRQLPKERVLELLRRCMPAQFEQAEIVGKWIWITFSEQPADQIRQQLSQFGFHWNNIRKCWQHPCGQVTAGTPKDPREKYGSYYAADQQAA